MTGLNKDEIQHIVDRELLHLDGYKDTMPVFDDYDPAFLGERVPRDQFILHSGHRDLTAQALANVEMPMLVMGGAPGIGKSYHHPGGHLDDRFIHIQYDVDFDRLYDIPRYLGDESYVGERRVNKARKIKDRQRNKAARKARRAGR